MSLSWKEWAQKLELKSLFDLTQPVVVGCSGGPDSVFLTLVVAAVMDPTLVSVVYVDHGLRSVESIENEKKRVAQLASQLGTGFCSISVPVREVAQEKKWGIEAAARFLRQDIFFKCAAEHQASVVLLGHHQDDAVETAVMKWMRGAKTGLFGLKLSRRFFNNIRIIRPLLKLTKKEIVMILDHHQIGYCMDTSNWDETYNRNHIRHTILPQLRQLFPDFDRKIGSLLEHLSDVHAKNEGVMMPYLSFLVIKDTTARYPLDVLASLEDTQLATLLKQICDQVYASFFETPSDVYVESKHIGMLMDSVRKSKGKHALPRQVFASVDPRGSLCFSKSKQGEKSE